jgi:hypothetical protein
MTGYGLAPLADESRAQQGSPPFCEGSNHTSSVWCRRCRQPVIQAGSVTFSAQWSRTSGALAATAAGTPTVRVNGRRTGRPAIPVRRRRPTIRPTSPRATATTKAAAHYRKAAGVAPWRLWNRPRVGRPGGCCQRGGGLKGHRDLDITGDGAVGVTGDRLGRRGRRSPRAAARSGGRRWCRR